MISLQQAKQLVELLENDQRNDADELFVRLYKESSVYKESSFYKEYESPVLKEIGALTRDLHNELTQFSIDQRINELANDEIPDAKDRLQFVIQKTEIAANKTMDAVEQSLPIADNLLSGLQQVRPQWNALMSGKIGLEEFKTLCHGIDQLLKQIEGDSSILRNQLTDILMAQDFQDLTGQIIRRVITLVGEVEQRLVDILTIFAVEHPEDAIEKPKRKSLSSIEAEGPILNPEQRDDAVSSQDDVDDLLSSLGF